MFLSVRHKSSRQRPQVARDMFSRAGSEVDRALHATRAMADATMRRAKRLFFP